MVVNVGAYATEIVRAGIENISRGQIEAGLALGLRPLQVFRYVVLFPALQHRLSGAVQPVHPADAQFQRGLDDFGAGTDGDRQRPAVAHLPQLRDLHRRHRHLPGVVDAVLRRVRRPSTGRCSHARASAEAGGEHARIRHQRGAVHHRGGALDAAAVAAGVRRRRHRRAAGGAGPHRATGLAARAWPPATSRCSRARRC